MTEIQIYLYNFILFILFYFVTAKEGEGVKRVLNS